MDSKTTNREEFVRQKEGAQKKFLKTLPRMPKWKDEEPTAREIHRMSHTSRRKNRSTDAKSRHLGNSLSRLGCEVCGKIIDNQISKRRELKFEFEREMKSLRANSTGHH